jgi:protease IV
MKRRTAWILVAGVAAVSLGAAAVGAVALLLRSQSGGAPVFASSTYLALDLGGEIPDEPPAEASLFERHATSLRTFVQALDLAAADPKVTSLLLRVSSLSDAGWAKTQELHAAVVRFRKSGKPAYAHLEYVGNKEYYLATACSRIYALPTAIVNVSGLSAEVMFFRKTLDKLGVQAQFEGVGKYKNAPNTFTESAFTEPHREQMEALLDSLYEQYVEGLGSARGLSADEVRHAVDDGPYDAHGAQAAGLVDELLYRDEVETRLKGAERVTAGRYVKASRGFGYDTRPKVALVYTVGDIITGTSQSGFGGTFAGSDTVAGALRDARQDDDIRAIVLRVDSPGGFGPAADAIRREVELAQKVKPVIVSMGDYAASGGYYVTIGSDTIVAQPGTITGSIGVFSGKFTLRGLYDKVGITKEVLTRGANAALFSEYQPWSDSDRARIRGQNVAFYEDFVRKVAEGRKKTYAEIDAVAQGRVWTGAEALQHGLVDRLGGLDTALDVARERAKLGQADVNVVVLPPRKGFFETLWDRQREDELESAAPREMQALLHWTRAIVGDGPIARLPFDLRFR